ncbi:hypothetical protein POVCU2_0060930 [Plasmodium ovale curtisi]|uniref:PIR Superfamily Protein n=1 Tax=Plasmodium ovale curtisi TaxID=864141 RepID=A0A1A8WGN9_PLAOA|nr:hypothetical protein POVCU2_0060930 [Plasmodium ovale curtisi]
MTKFLPSKKYKNQLENGIKYSDIEKNMEIDKLITNLEFWSTTFPVHLGKYIDNHMDEWSKNNIKKRYIDYFKNIISEINRDNCNEIKNYIEEQIKEIGPIYASSDTKYSGIIGYY